MAEATIAIIDQESVLCNSRFMLLLLFQSDRGSDGFGRMQVCCTSMGREVNVIPIRSITTRPIYKAPLESILLLLTLGRNQSSVLTESIHRFRYTLSVEGSSGETRILWRAFDFAIREHAKRL